MAANTLTLKYITKKKYDALTDEEKVKAGYIYFVKNSDGDNYNALYSNGKCFGASSNNGNPVGIVYIEGQTDLPVIGKTETMYVCPDGTTYFWNNDSLKWVTTDGTYDEIHGGDASL